MSSTERGTGRKVAIGLVWFLTVVEFLGMGLAGMSKFQGEVWPTMFEGWGYPASFALVIGATELGSALLLLAPKLASYSAALLIAVMLGALWTVMSPSNQTELGPGIVALNIAALTIILLARWNVRWQPGGPDPREDPVASV